MNERQKKLLLMLLQAEASTPVQDLALALNCSEKTVRNDFKYLDQWLRQHGASARIMRAPNIGAHLMADEEERRRLRQWLNTSHPGTAPAAPDEWKRRGIVVQKLLQAESPHTVQDLAAQCFVTKAVMRADLSFLAAWLRPFGLELQRRQKRGVCICGEEKAWRFAIVAAIKEWGNLCEWYQPYEYTLVQDRLNRLVTGVTFTDEALVNLTLHVLIAIKRIKTGHWIEIPFERLEKIKDSQEYQWALQLTRLLEQPFALSFPFMETAYLAIHLQGANLYFTNSARTKREEILARLDSEAIAFARRLIALVDEVVDEQLTRDEDLLLHLSAHLHAALHRLRHGLILDNPLTQKIKEMYRFLFEAVLSVLPSLEQEFHVTVPEEEAAYLVLHLQTSLERKKGRFPSHKRVLIVCTMGIGISQLLAARLRRAFPALIVLDTVSRAELPRAIARYQPDFLLSTVPLEPAEMKAAIPVVTVSPLFTAAEQKKLAQFLEEQEKRASGMNAAGYPELQRLLDPERILLLEEAGQMEIIERLCSLLEDKGIVDTPAFRQSAKQREAVSPTAIGGGIAIPHGNPHDVRQSAVALARLTKPAEWGGEKVFLVFLLALDWREKERTRRLFAELTVLSEDEATLAELRRQTTASDLIACLTPTPEKSADFRNLR